MYGFVYDKLHLLGCNYVVKMSQSSVISPELWNFQSVFYDIATLSDGTYNCLINIDT